MINNSEESSRQTLKRPARANGHSGIICIPAECIGRTYKRYINTVKGNIALIPADERAKTPEERT